MDDININSYKPQLKSPLSACIWLTDYCNLSCKYCYAAGKERKHIDGNRVVEIIDELIDLDVLDIVFAGGEPLLHPQFFTILKRALKRDVQIGVLTNGVLLNKENREKLLKLASGKKDFLLQVSLDSSFSEINNKTRGCSDLVIENLEEMSKTDILIQTSTVVNKHNIDTAHLIIERFYPRIKRFHFLNLQRTFESLKHLDLFPTEEETKGFWKNLLEYSKKYPGDLFLPSLRIMNRIFDKESESFNQTASFKCKTCTAGITHINIDPSLNVLGCDIAKDYSTIGNLKDKSFEEVWNSKRAYEFRNQNIPACYYIKNQEGRTLLEMYNSAAYP